MALDDEDFAKGMCGLPGELVGRVVGFLSIRELLVIAELKEWAAQSHEELHDRFSALMKQSLLPVDATQQMMDRTNSVISGSGALYVCNPGPWVPRDIDFYCPLGALRRVIRFLEKHGYEEVVESKGEGAEGGDNATGGLADATGGSTMPDVQHQIVNEADDEDTDGSEDEGDSQPEQMYAKHVMKNVVVLQKGGVGGPILNVIESLLPCSEAPIFCFHSTAVMNVVTSKGVSCFYPEWTLQDKGVVNRASGLTAWKAAERNREHREHKGLTKYRERGYTIHEDCGSLHKPGEKICEACGPFAMNWDAGLSMTFKQGGTFAVTGRIFCWRLGQRLEELKKLFWKDRGAVIIVQGDGDGRALVYDGYLKVKRLLTREGVRRFFPSTT
ncbi:hypothetical protein NMY22_g10040 [Coprinellus aureogranulatus]|nr:hypothetical protein NMY22_g10040 [Coprinellus aureogranulatus]